MSNEPNDELTELIYQANYYDNLRNIDEMMKYSFKILNIDPIHKDSIEKIIYWSVSTKNYQCIIDLLKLLYKNDKAIDIAKNIFYRETRSSLRKLMIDAYINLIKMREGNEYFKYNRYDISFYMKKVLSLYNDIDINHLIGEYMHIENDNHNIEYEATEFNN